MKLDSTLVGRWWGRCSAAPPVQADVGRLGHKHPVQLCAEAPQDAARAAAAAAREPLASLRGRRRSHWQQRASEERPHTALTVTWG